MSKYSVLHACGCETTHQIYGPVKDRDQKAAWLATQPCAACARAAQTAAAIDANIGLPALAGSEKQVAWAETIRAGWFADADMIRAKMSAMPPVSERDRAYAAAADSIYSARRAETNAAAWIDSRNDSFRELVRRAVAG